LGDGGNGFDWWGGKEVRLKKVVKRKQRTGCGGGGAAGSRERDRWVFF